MENLTLAQQILKTHVGVKPVEGHTVVVLEKTEGSGEEYRFEIEPGQTAPKTRLDLFQWLLGRRSERYFAYAVTGDPQLRTTFSTDVTLRTRIHTFALRITLGYRIGEPKKLVIHRNDDPLRKVREEIASLLRTEFAQRDWISILIDFPALAREVEAKFIGTISSFAATYGLSIAGIALDHTLPPDEIKRLREIEEAELEKDRIRRDAETVRVTASEGAATAAAKADHEHTLALQKQQQGWELEGDADGHAIESRGRSAQVAIFKRMDALADAVTRATTRAIEAAGASIQNPKELVQAISSMRAALTEMRSLNQPAAEHGLTSPEFAGMIGAGDSSAALILTEMLATTKQMGLSAEERRKLQSSILHLIGELMLEAEASAEIVDLHIQRIQAIRAKVLEDEHLDYLEKFTDRKRLAREMR